MADVTLLALLADVRGKTLRILEGVDDAQARFAPPGLNNTILWHAGHVLVVNEHLGVAPATGKPVAYPEGWAAKFDWQSRPATVTQWPRLSEVVAQLQEQQRRFAAAIESLTEEQLAKPQGQRTLRHSIMHGLHDEANHQGEMWLLKKVWAKRDSNV